MKRTAAYLFMMSVIVFGCSSSYDGETSMFSLPTDASPEELEGMVFEISYDNVGGERVWYGNINNSAYYVSVGYRKGQPDKMTHLGITLEESAFIEMTKLPVMDYDSVEIDHVFFKVRNDHAEGSLFVSRLGLGN